jgi:hypothetical protein
MYLQANKPLFSYSSCSPQRLGIPPEELFAPAAEHETAPEGPIKSIEKKEALSEPPVHLYQ